MALTKCKECGKEISAEAAACPHCASKSAKAYGCAMIVAAVVLLVVFSTIAVNCQEQKERVAAAERLAALTPEQRATEDARKAAEAVVKAAEAVVKAKEDQLFDAKYACQQFVEKALHDPDNAEWAPYRDFYVKERKDGFFHVQLTVRAKNAFNATRLGTFDCVLRSSGDTWYPLSIKQHDVR